MRKTICIIMALFAILTYEAYAQNDSKIAVLQHGDQWLLISASNSGGDNAYHAWNEAGKDCNDKPLCPDGWRFPNKSEFELIRANLKYRNNKVYLENEIFKNRCYFPLLGFGGNTDSPEGFYWSSEENSEIDVNAFSLYISKDNDSDIISTAKESRLSVRCVKTNDPYVELKYNREVFYVYDRNAGVSVPKTGKAKNYSWKVGHKDYDPKGLFRGDYYTSVNMRSGKNDDGTPICPEGWWLPNRHQMSIIADNMKCSADDVYHIQKDNAKSYFPVHNDITYYSDFKAYLGLKLDSKHITVKAFGPFLRASDLLLLRCITTFK